MNTRLKTFVMAIVLAIAAAILLPLTASASTHCPTGWGSLPKSVQDLRQGEVDGVRTGRHQCFDRVVVDIDGPPGGYLVRYVDQVTADGSGQTVTTPGGARLQLTVQNPSYSNTRLGTRLANVTGYQTLRSVVYAGSFEGYTTYGVGVRARLPFRVFRIPGSHGKIVLDVAHKW